MLADGSKVVVTGSSPAATTKSLAAGIMLSHLADVIIGVVKALRLRWHLSSKDDTCVTGDEVRTPCR